MQVFYNAYTVWVKKWKPRFNPKSLKLAEKHHRIVISGQWMIAYLFCFIWYIGRSYWVSNGCSANQQSCCKACQKCLRPSFEFVVHNAVRMHELLLCCRSSRKCHHAAQATPTWTKQFWHVLQNWLLCSHTWPNMNEQYTKIKVQ